MIFVDKYLYQIGQKLSTNSSDFIILEQIMMNCGQSKTRKGYVCKCLKCDSKFKIFESNIKRGCGCSVCSNHKVKRGYNDLCTKYPDIAKMLLNQNDGYTHLPQSNKIAKWKCPNCGLVIEKQYNVVLRNGLCCPCCSDGFSIPNRFMASVLSCIGINFETEKLFEWSHNKRYDFYIPQINTLIEMQGGQHYQEIAFMRGSQKENDEFKRKIAIDNGITHYICVDARKSDFEYLMNSIKCSELSFLIDFDKVDESKVKENLTTPLSNKVAELWNSGYKIVDISNRLQINRITTRKYLQQAADRGLCDYDKTTAQKRGAKGIGKKKPVICVTTGMKFESALAAEQYYHIRHVGECCNGNLQSAGKYNGIPLCWEFINL